MYLTSTFSVLGGFGASVYLRELMEIITSLLIFLFWIFVVNMATRFIKKLMNPQEAQKKQQKQGEQDSPETGPTPEEVFKDIQRKLQEARKKQEELRKKEAQTDRGMRRYDPDQPDKQKIYQQKSTTSEKEKRSTEEFQKALTAARKKQHDADKSRLQEKAILQEPEKESYPEFELDLRNAIIGSIVLERPYE